jgi:hypothetical protein
MDILARVKREATRLAGAEDRFAAAVQDARDRGASLRAIETAIRETVGPRRRYGRETLRAITRRDANDAR